MAHDIEVDERPMTAIRASVRALLGAMLERVERIAAGTSADVADDVHGVRKRGKEVRALVRLLAPPARAARQVDDAVTEVGGLLGGTRDAHVLDETLAAVRAATPVGEHAAFDVLDGRPGARVEPIGVEVLGRAAALLRAADAEVSTWAADGDAGDVLDRLEQAYRVARRRLRVLRDDPTSDLALHAWRKAVKRYWYQLRALSGMAPSVVGPMVESLDRLAESLGQDHDVTVLVEHLDDGTDRQGAPAVVDAARRHQAELRDTAMRLGATLFAERPSALRRRLGRYWALTCRLGPER
jgi:CHAD domain-containing protein